jgi:RNAse (barnase) inhibitor barstar
MQQGISLQELAKQLKEVEEQKRDFIVSTPALWMRETGKSMEMEGNGSYMLTDVFHDQVADKLQIPRTYYGRMLETAPDLLSTNVNAWFRKEPEKRMVRTLNIPNGNIMRAFLSDKFTTTRDNAVVAQAVLPVLFRQQTEFGMEIKSCDLTPKRLYLQCVYPKLQAEIKLGDAVQGGIVISNSEIGLGSFQIELLIYRLVCMNGMIRPATIRKHHVGRRIDTDEEVNTTFYRRETIQADQKAFEMKVADVVNHSFDKKKFDEEVLKLQESATDIFKARKAGDLVEEVSKKFNISKDDGGNILDALADGNDFSRWGLANAITFQACGAKDYDKSIEFERIGGKIIDLPRSEWKAMLN